MALPQTALPFGIRDVKVTPINADGSLGTAVDLPNARVFSFTEAEDFETLRGDDQVVAVRGMGPQVEWDLEGGGISLEAYAVLAGGTITTSGTTPNIVKTYAKGGRDTRPYFKVEGQAISDSGGDLHTVVYRCRCDGTLEGEFSDGSFFLTSANGRGFPDPNNGDALYDFVHNETATAIV